MGVTLRSAIVEPRGALSDRPWKPHRRRGARGQAGKALVATFLFVAVIVILVGGGALLGLELAGR